MDQLRLQFKDTLLQGAANGTLRQVLRGQAKDDADELEDLRLKAMTTLSRAAKAGELKTVLAPASIEDSVDKAEKHSAGNRLSGAFRRL